MKTERKELPITMPNGNTETFHVLRLLDDNGDEQIWQMRSFVNDMCPPMHFATEEEYTEHVREWEEIFEFPSWDDIYTPGVGGTLFPWSSDLTPNEIHQWLFDILFEFRSCLDGFEIDERIRVSTIESRPDDSIPMPEFTIGILLKKPTMVLDVLYAPKTPGFEDPMEGMKNTMLAFMSLGHEQVPISVSVPVIWNHTQNKSNVFNRGDLCSVRFVNGFKGGHMSDYIQYMTSWDAMPFNDIWKLWK
jgi:hypothetical protein